VPAAVPSSAYDQANQQLAFGPVTQTFDPNGNRLTQTDPSGTITYTWDARNRLVALSGPAVSASFAYDAVGRRLSKTINGTMTTFLYDGLDIIREGGGGGDASYLRTLSIDEAISRTEGAETIHYLGDVLGNTVALADTAGSPTTTYTYAPFGETSVAGPPSANAVQYTGRENDGTGLYYYRARYYDPIQSRFISEDPIGLAGGINAYSYVLNDPVIFVDPLGWEKLYTGYATYYNLVGYRTASGVPFDPNALAAAMTAEKAPFGTEVTVEYTYTDKEGKSHTRSICVRVNDRGPFERAPDRKPLYPLRPDPEKIIDLTPTAFQKLVGSLGPGKVRVRVRVP
jgi:RHS repeat-associated protein